MSERGDQLANSPTPQAATPLLSPEESTRLIEFARALKAAARAVLLYPMGHPAISTTLGRIVDMTSSARLTVPLRITVLPDALLLDERAAVRADPALSELAEILHNHVIGALTIQPGGDLEAWRNFLLLVGRAPDTLRAEGGIARVWATTAGQHVELREIDYAQVMRERKGGQAAIWDQVVANCLQGDDFDLDDAGLDDLLQLAGDSERLPELMADLETRATAQGGITAGAAALLRMLRGIVDAVSKREPDRLEPVLRNMAGAVGRLTPDTLLGLLSRRGDQQDEGSRVISAVASRMTDSTIAQFVSRNVIDSPSSTDRIAEVFQTLVKGEDRGRLLALAREDVAESPLGSTEGFEGVWDQVAEKMLTSYTDESFVSDEYGRELSNARMRALDVEQAAERSARARQRVAGDGGHGRAALARYDAGARSAAHRGRRR